MWAGFPRTRGDRLGYCQVQVGKEGNASGGVVGYPAASAKSPYMASLASR